MKLQQYYAIIAAGGSGIRLESKIPKQFHLINNKPILFYSLYAFYKSIYKPKIILVLNSNYKDYWVDLCKKHSIDIHHSIVEASSNRSLTIKNAIDTISNINSIVAIHDGVRPLIGTRLIDNLYKEASKLGNAIPYISLVDAIVKNSTTGRCSLNKKEYSLVQTPQCFKTAEIKDAYNKLNGLSYDDDASLMEANGASINFIQGDRLNIKITYSSDLIIAKALLDIASK